MLGIVSELGLGSGLGSVSGLELVLVLGSELACVLLFAFVLWLGLYWASFKG